MSKSKTLTYHGLTAKLIDDARYDKFYAKLVAGNWEPATFDVLAAMVDSSTTYIDIGAWIGVTPLWAASRAKKVIAVEPDPYCVQTLKFLITENACKNLVLLDGALAKEEVVELGENGGFGSSESSLLVKTGQNTVKVRGVKISDILKEAGHGPKFCKIDIEGFEYEITDHLLELAVPEMKGMQVAIHPQLLLKAKRWPWGIGHLMAAAATWQLIKSLSNAGFDVKANGKTPWLYVLSQIILAPKIRGAELFCQRPTS